MTYVGLLIAFAGFMLSLLSLGMTASNGARLGIVLFGIALTLFGIIGVINKHYLKTALWRK